LAVFEPELEEPEPESLVELEELGSDFFEESSDEPAESPFPSDAAPAFFLP
jgi:hypothetical protein